MFLLKSAQSLKLSSAAQTLNNCLRVSFISYVGGFDCVELYCIACGVDCGDYSEIKSGFLTWLAFLRFLEVLQLQSMGISGSTLETQLRACKREGIHIH